MLARVVVGETYDRRNEGQVSFIVLYIICVTGRVVVGETYDRSNEVGFSIKFCKHF